MPGSDWPRYSEDTREILVIDRTDHIETDPHGERRLAWHEGTGIVADGVLEEAEELGSEFDAARGI